MNLIHPKVPWISWMGRKHIWILGSSDLPIMAEPKEIDRTAMVGEFQRPAEAQDCCRGLWNSSRPQRLWGCVKFLQEFRNTWEAAENEVHKTEGHRTFLSWTNFAHFRVEYLSEIPCGYDKSGHLGQFFSRSLANCRHADFFALDKHLKNPWNWKCQSFFIIL